MISPSIAVPAQSLEFYLLPPHRRCGAFRRFARSLQGRIICAPPVLRPGALDTRAWALPLMWITPLFVRDYKGVAHALAL